MSQTREQRSRQIRFLSDKNDAESKRQRAELIKENVREFLTRKEATSRGQGDPHPAQPDSIDEPMQLERPTEQEAITAAERKLVRDVSEGGKYATHPDADRIKKKLIKGDVRRILKLDPQKG